MKTHISLSVAVVTVMSLGACSSLSQRKVELELAQDSIVGVGENTNQPQKKGEILELGTEPVWVESPGYVSMLVIPARTDSKKINLI